MNHDDDARAETLPCPVGGLCAQTDPELFGPLHLGENHGSERIRQAKSTCARCPFTGDGGVCWDYTGQFGDFSGVAAGEVWCKGKVRGVRIGAAASRRRRGPVKAAA